MPKIKLYSGRRPRIRPRLLQHSNIPKPLHGLSPRTLNGKAWWDRERQRAYEKANYYCECCGVHKTEAKIHNWLEAHECYDINYTTGVATYKGIAALCHCCHSFIHHGRLQKLKATGGILTKDYNTIMKHGESTLKNHKLKPWYAASDDSVEWGKWVLVIGKNKYKSKFKDYNEWESYYKEEYD